MSARSTAARKRLLKVDEVATLLNVSRWFVYDHGAELGLVKIGGLNRYRRDRVDASIARAFGGSVEAAERTPRPPSPPRGSRRIPLLEPGREPP